MAERHLTLHRRNDFALADNARMKLSGMTDRHSATKSLAPPSDTSRIVHGPNSDPFSIALIRAGWYIALRLFFRRCTPSFRGDPERYQIAIPFLGDETRAKFVSEETAVYHELRKWGTGPDPCRTT